MSVISKLFLILSATAFSSGCYQPIDSQIIFPIDRGFVPSGAKDVMKVRQRFLYAVNYSLVNKYPAGEEIKRINKIFENNKWRPVILEGGIGLRKWISYPDFSEKERKYVYKNSAAWLSNNEKYIAHILYQYTDKYIGSSNEFPKSEILFISLNIRIYDKNNNPKVVMINK
jgi:hypothetical protein